MITKFAPKREVTTKNGKKYLIFKDLIFIFINI